MFRTSTHRTCTYIYPADHDVGAMMGFIGTVEWQPDENKESPWKVFISVKDKDGHSMGESIGRFHSREAGLVAFGYVYKDRELKGQN